MQKSGIYEKTYNSAGDDSFSNHVSQISRAVILYSYLETIFFWIGRDLLKTYFFKRKTIYSYNKFNITFKYFNIVKFGIGLFLLLYL